MATPDARWAADSSNRGTQLESTTSPFTLQIERLWNGEPAGVGEAASLRIVPGPLRWTLDVEAPYHGDAAPQGAAGPTWALWEHEVVECFIAGPEDRYLEVELGPHGHHLVLRLNGIRQIEERELPLEYEVVRAGDRWSGRALIPFHWLPERPWRVNAYSIHGQGASRRYLAAMPGHGDTPDFHQLDSFMWLPPS